MKEITTISFIVCFFLILNVKILFAQSSDETVKFLNYEWGISPEQVITVLKQESPNVDIEEIINQEDKALGMRAFKADGLRYIGCQWTLQFVFMDNKLAYVHLNRGKIEKSKLVRRLDTIFGAHENLLFYEEWKGKDGSELHLIEINVPSEKFMLSFKVAGFHEELRKREENIK